MTAPNHPNARLIEISQAQEIGEVRFDELTAGTVQTVVERRVAERPDGAVVEFVSSDVTRAVRSFLEENPATPGEVEPS